MACGANLQNGEETGEKERQHGCNRYTSFFYIALPLTTPGLVATGIFTFILCWSEFVFALTIVNDTNMFTLTIGLAAIKST